MGIDENVVDINHFKQQDEKYTAQLNISVQALLKMEEELTTQAVNLAVHGAWKEWNDQIQEGETFHFTDEMLHDTGDPIVSEIMAITDSVATVIEQIEEILN
jgi:hypothetical protein